MHGKKEDIRVGMIRCDKRALWYGAIFDEIEPDVFAALAPAAYHHFTFYSTVTLRHKRATGFKLVKVFDKNRKAAEDVARAFGGRPEVCRTLDEASDDVDVVFIANEAGDGGDHVRLAAPGLRKGMPTFIDRPLARTVKDARALIRLARRNRAPLLSCSHMRLLPHAEWFKRRFAELDPLERGIVHGHGPNPAEVADGVQLALFLFGDEFGGRAESVRSMGAWPLEVMFLTYAKPRIDRKSYALVVNSHGSGERQAFHASASSAFKPIYLDDMDAFVQTEGGLGVMTAIGKMVRSRKPPLPYESMLEPVVVTEAGRKAHNKATSAPLRNFR